MLDMAYVPANIVLQMNMISNTRKKNYNVLSMIGNWILAKYILEYIF